MKDIFKIKNSLENPKKTSEVILMEIVPDVEIISAETAITKLESMGYKVDDYVKIMLKEVDWNKKGENLYNIVSIPIGEILGDKDTESFLDFKKKYTYKDIIEKAKESGYDLVPAALVPEIRLNYVKNGERATIAMDAIPGRYGLIIFNCAGNDYESWLSYSSGNGQDKWDSSERFFFIRKLK